MNMMILGSGGREYAFYLKIRQSNLVKKLYFAPGNGGVESEFSINIDINNFKEVEETVKKYQIDFLLVGPELPLVNGIKDYFSKALPGLHVFGPNGYGAQLEGSKVFSNDFMVTQKIPTAISKEASNLESALTILKNHTLPVVIKVDGLAAGKGVTIHDDKNEAQHQLDLVFNKKIFGDAGKKILFQEFMQGKEASLFALCNGKDAIYLPTACDYKRVFDDGKGPNTGGMGSYAPGTILTPDNIAFVHKNIVQKVIDKFNYTGILYVGLMIHENDISVVEFNCRLGDPETQSVLPLIESDIVPYLLWSAGAEKNVYKVTGKGYYHVPQKPGYSLNVVISAAGYPGNYEKNLELHLPEKLPENVHIVHAGTKKIDGKILSSGGRILNIVGYDKDARKVKEKVYEFINSLKKINDFSKLHYRTDIGK